MSNVVPEAETNSESEPDRVLRHVREALRGLRYGTISIIVQDGVAVQIDRTEKRRLQRPPREAAGRDSSTLPTR